MLLRLALCFLLFAQLLFPFTSSALRDGVAVDDDVQRRWVDAKSLTSQSVLEDAHKFHSNTSRKAFRGPGARRLVELASVAGRVTAWPSWSH